MSSGSSFEVRPMREEDVEPAVALQRDCFPPPFPEDLLWRPEHLARHRALFPEGQFVAVMSPGGVVGSASSLVLSESRWNRHAAWEETVGGFDFDHHDPTGTTLYGADISVHPEFRGRGIGRALYRARFDLVARHGLTRFGTACRMPDYAAWAARTAGDVHEYARLVASGSLVDRTMTPLLRYGLSLVGVVEDHMDDVESGNAAAILEWSPS